MTNYRPGILAGIISGAIWAALISAISALLLFLSYPQALAYYNSQYIANRTIFGGDTPATFIAHSLEVNTAVAFGTGIAFGFVIGLLFVWMAPRFLPKQTYTVKGAVLAIFFWLLYELGIAGFPDLVEILSSLAVSILAGYLLGILYLRFAGPQSTKLLQGPARPSGEQPDQCSTDIGRR